MLELWFWQQLPGLGVREHGHRDVDRACNVTTAQARCLIDQAVEARGGTKVYHLHVLGAVEQALGDVMHLGDVRDHEAWVDDGKAVVSVLFLWQVSTWHVGARVELPTFFLPFLKTSIHNPNLSRTEEPEHPGSSGDRAKPVHVVTDYDVVFADLHLLHMFDENLSTWQSVDPLRLWVDDVTHGEFLGRLTQPFIAELSVARAVPGTDDSQLRVPRADQICHFFSLNQETFNGDNLGSILPLLFLEGSETFEGVALPLLDHFFLLLLGAGADNRSVGPLLGRKQSAGVPGLRLEHVSRWLGSHTRRNNWLLLRVRHLRVSLHWGEHLNHRVVFWNRVSTHVQSGGLIASCNGLISHWIACCRKLVYSSTY